MANTYNLSEGVLQIIMCGGDFANPVVQVLGCKKINASTPGKDRFRLLLSDGKYSISFAMLTTQSNDKVGSEGIPKHSIIKINRYLTSMINNAGRGETRVLLVLDLDYVATGDVVDEIIGSPIQLNDKGMPMDKSGSTTTTDGASGNHGTGHQGPSSSVATELSTPGSTFRSTNASATGAPTANSVNLNQTASFENRVVSPISSISPYHNKWVIKARVTNKSAIRTWSNSKGEGKLFSLDLVDESGEIRCTAFRDMVDKYYDYIQLDKVYYISKCQLKPANKQFSTLKNDYEMTMTSETIVEECQSDVGNIPQTQYNFTSIDKLAIMEVGAAVDVIGVCKSASELQTFTARSTNRELKKKEVILVDQTNNAIALTLWGTQAENFDGTNNPVVVIKSAKIGEFGGGKNLSATMSSQIKVNPDMPECYRLKGWFDSEGCQSNIVNISTRGDAGGNFQTAWMSFRDVQEKRLGQSEKGDYFKLMGTVLLIRSSKSVYKACPKEECNKKVVDMENGMYRCEKCSQEYPNFKYRLLASMNVGDWSGNQWISMFSSEAERVLGKTAQEVGHALENDSDLAQSIFESVNFKQFIFKCRSKMETYNDEARLKTVAVKVDPVNYEEYNKYLVEEIQQLVS